MRPLPLLLALIVLTSPSALADEGGEGGRAPVAPAAPRGPRAGEEAGPPKTIAEAWSRLERIRRIPVGGPGSLVRRRARVDALAKAALALPAAREATGEDLGHLAELAGDAGMDAEAADLSARYLAAEGEKPAEGRVRAVLVRSLSGLGRVDEAAKALEAWRKTSPDAEGIPALTRTLADALVRAGRTEEALARYREALSAAHRVAPRTAPAVSQAASELLLALGRVEEARGLVEEAARASKGEAAGRYETLRARIAMVGKPLPDLAAPRWAGGEPPAAESLAGKIVVRPVFAWWMEARLEDLARWQAEADRLGPRGLVVLPLTRTTGWDPEKGRFTRAGRPPEKEIGDIEAAVREAGWKGPFAVAPGGEAFATLGVRGLPMEFVLDREGVVRFVRAGGEVGPDLSVMVVERLLVLPAAAGEPR